MRYRYIALGRTVTTPEVAVHPLRHGWYLWGRAALPGARARPRPRSARPARHWPRAPLVSRNANQRWRHFRWARPGQWARGGGGTPHAHRGNGRAGGPGWRRCRVSGAPWRGCPEPPPPPPPSPARPLPRVLPAGLCAPGTGRAARRPRAGSGGPRVRWRGLPHVTSRRREQRAGPGLEAGGLGALRGLPRPHPPCACVCVSPGACSGVGVTFAARSGHSVAVSGKSLWFLFSSRLPVVCSSTASAAARRESRGCVARRREVRSGGSLAARREK